MIDSETDLIELNHSEESEEDNKEDKDHKMNVGLNTPKFKGFRLDGVISQSDVFKTGHHPEITTPPPQYLIIHS